jgi:hypothetical protein
VPSGGFCHPKCPDHERAKYRETGAGTKGDRLVKTMSYKYLLLSSLASIAFTGGAAQAAENDSSAQDSGEIIVTAQRKSERLIDVPISITAVSGEQLSQAGISNTLELSQVTAGLEMPFFVIGFGLGRQFERRHLC